MNIPWEAPDHTNRLGGYQQHAKVNPTAPSADPGLVGGGSEESWPAGPVPVGIPVGAGKHVPPTRKRMWLAAVLALLGPLGLFYVGILNGIAALIVCSSVLPPIVKGMASSTGIADDSLRTWLALPLAWCICVPWALLATLVHNARVARRKPPGEPAR